ncbi:MAG: NifU family protein [Proteobacteria bacterium]|nr:MAG: NifU family protein [Pseudomonadota bacterium]
MEAKSVDIRLEFTPNPNALKYVVDDHVLMERGTASFTDRAAAESSPLANRLMAIPGVAACMVGSNFVSVTKSDDGDWEVLDTKTRDALKAHVNSGEPAVNPLSLEKPASTIREGETELDRRIRDVLDRDIRPAVAMDGGDVVFEKFENGVVYLYMQGACAGCPSSTATLKMGIETRIRAAVPEVQEVVAL